MTSVSFPIGAPVELRPERPLVIGVGHRLRCDDAAGPLLMDRLAAHGWPVREESGEGVALMEAWSGQTQVLVVDAAVSGAPPGTLHRFDATTTLLPSSLFRGSSHLFGVAQAVELARSLGRLPPRLEILAIEGRNFAFGETLTPEVATAIEVALALLLADPLLKQSDSSPPNF